MTEHSNYLPLIKMSESHHDKYNMVEKYIFDMVPPDELSVNSQAIQIFQSMASQAQIEVRSFWFYLLI